MPNEHFTSRDDHRWEHISSKIFYLIQHIKVMVMTIHSGKERTSNFNLLEDSTHSPPSLESALVVADIPGCKIWEEDVDAVKEINIYVGNHEK